MLWPIQCRGGTNGTCWVVCHFWNSRPLREMWVLRSCENNSLSLDSFGLEPWAGALRGSYGSSRCQEFCPGCWEILRPYLRSLQNLQKQIFFCESTNFLQFLGLPVKFRSCNKRFFILGLREGKQSCQRRLCFRKCSHCL